MVQSFKFNFPIFLIAFSLGLLYIYIIGPERKAIIKYPTPYNNNVIYKDNANNCYVYESKKVSCTENPTKVIPQPVV